MLAAADAVGAVPVSVLHDMVTGVLQFVMRELLPHAELEDRVLYAAVEKVLESPRAADTMRREHDEVGRTAQELSDLLGSLASGDELPDRLARDLRRVLYGIHAVLSLHFAKEEHVYLPLLAGGLSATEQTLVLADLVSHAHH